MSKLFTILFLSISSICVAEEIPVRAQVLFSPLGGIEKAIIQEIDNAKSRIFVQAFIFRQPSITEALIRAHKNGKEVQVILDTRAKTKDLKETQKLVDNGIPTRIDNLHATAHNKIMIIDHDTVLTGSYNFTRKAENKNAENFLILRSSELTQRYLNNWMVHSEHSETLN